MKSTILKYLALLAVLPLAGVAENDNPRKPSGLSALLSVVRENNAALKAARARWSAARERVPQEKAWEDLKVSYDSLLGRYVEVPPDAFTNQMLTIEQMIPLSGKNLSRARAASAEANAALEDLRRMQHDVLFKAKQAYYRLATAYAQLELNSRDTELLDQFSKITLVKYEVAARPQSEVFAAEIELAKTRESRSDLERDRSDQEAELNTLMNRPAGSPIGKPPPLQFTELGVSAAQAEETALRNRPELLRSTRQIDVAKARLQLARRQWFPDPAVNLKAQSYNEARQGVSELDAGISFNIPWVNYSKYSAGVREAERNLDSARNDLDQTGAEASSLVRDQLKKIETLAHHYELFKTTIVPLAEQAVKSMRSSYESDKASFLELTAAQRNLREVESTLLGHLVEHEIAIAELHSIIGDDPDVSLNPHTKP